MQACRGLLLLVSTRNRVASGLVSRMQYSMLRSMKAPKYRPFASGLIDMFPNIDNTIFVWILTPYNSAYGAVAYTSE